MNKLVCAILFALVFQGCLIRSLHPLYTQKDLIFEATLVGKWGEAHGKDTWTFQQSGSSYILVHDQEGASAHFDARLLKLKGMLFLDMRPKKAMGRNDFYNAHLVPAHTFLRCWIARDTLQLSVLNDNWVKQLLEKNPNAIKHEEMDGEIVLTAPTEALQKFVLRYADNREAFPDRSILVRRGEN